MFRVPIAAIAVALLSWTTPGRRVERLSGDDVKRVEAIVAGHTKETIVSTRSFAPLVATVVTSATGGPYAGSVYTLTRKGDRWIITAVGCRR